MGLSISLLPFYEKDYNMPFSTTKLNLDRDNKLFDKLLELRSCVVPENYYAKFIKNIDVSSLRYTIVEDLLYLTDFVFSRNSFRNKAAWSYLKELPSDLGVVLYWH